MKKIFLTLSVLLAAISAFAAKPTVYVREFGNPADTKDAWVQSIRGAVLQGLQKAGRVTIIDAIAEESRFDEEMRRLKGNLDTEDLSTAEALKTRGAHFILTGDVNSVKVTSSTLSSGTVSYDATASYTIKVVDASDGAMVLTETFSLPANFAKGLLNVVTKAVAESEDAAVNNILGDATGSMKKFSIKAFPMIGSVEDIDQLSKNGKEVKTLYIGLGSEDGVVKGTKFDVKVEQKIGKRTALKNIGTCEAQEIAGDDISLCEVKKGGAEIKNALDAGQTLKVQSQEK